MLNGQSHPGEKDADPLRWRIVFNISDFGTKVSVR